MLRRVYIVLYISVVLVIHEGVGDDRQGAAINGFTPEDITILLNSHNEYRRKAGSSNMRALTWNTDLQGMAQGWVDLCRFAHNTDTENRFGFSKVGENLYISGTDTYEAEEAVESWHEEINYYDYDNHICNDITCGHYTQVVWAESYEVGCGIRWCSNISDIGIADLEQGHLIVCNYGPGGNLAGVKPYLLGTPCTQCAGEGATCTNNLCSGGVVPTVTPGRQGADINGFTPNDITDILKKHNEYRRQAGSSNMRALTWNTDLEGMAQGWVDLCKFGLNSDTQNRFGFSKVGENLYISGADTYEAVEAVESWHEEINYYNYEALNCSDICDHYTQIVWADSYEVGCGIRWCSNISNIGIPDLEQGHLIVCNYGPGGNSRNTKPFKTGTACTECPADAQVCSDGLCAVMDQTTLPPTTTPTTSISTTTSTTTTITSTASASTASPTTPSTPTSSTASPTTPSTPTHSTASPTTPSTPTPSTASPTTPSTPTPSTASPTTPSTPTTPTPSTASPTTPSTPTPSTASPTTPSTPTPSTASPTPSLPPTGSVMPDTTVQFSANNTIPTHLSLETQIIQTFVIFGFVAASVSVCFTFNTLRNRFSRKVDNVSPKLSSI